jgi:hypothetical protein
METSNYFSIKNILGGDVTKDNCYAEQFIIPQGGSSLQPWKPVTVNKIYVMSGVFVC